MPADIINKSKNIIIALLIVLAVYQTSRLWLGDFMSHNFFDRFINGDESLSDRDLYKSFTYPYRIITGFGNSRFVMSYSDMENNEMRRFTDTVLAAAVKNGEYIGQADVDWVEMLASRAIIYEYSFTMPQDLFLLNFPSGSGGLSFPPEGFDTIVVKADTFSSSLLRLYFINIKSDICFEINLNNIEFCDALRQNIQNLQRSFDDNDMYYISTKLLRMDTPSNYFIPQWRTEGYTYFAGITNVKYYDSELDRAQIRTNLMTFFDNPSAVWDSSNEVVSSSDENITVRYLDTDVLEYTNYRQDITDNVTSAVNDYASAIKFIKNRDPLMDNEIYLAGYEEADGYRYIHFNYLAGDFPVIFVNQLSSSMEGLKYGITCTFRNGILINYKRLAYSFEINETAYERTAENYISHMDMYGIEAGDINNILFGYNAGIRDIAEGASMRLSVELTINGQKLVLA